MPEKQKIEAITSACLDLEGFIQDCRKTLLWLTQGNHEENTEPSVKETLQEISQLKEKSPFFKKLKFLVHLFDPIYGI